MVGMVIGSHTVLLADHFKLLLPLPDRPLDSLAGPVLRAKDVVLLVQHLSRTKEVLGSISSTLSEGHETQAYNPSTREGEAGSSEVKVIFITGKIPGQLGLHDTLS